MLRSRSFDRTAPLLCAMHIRHVPPPPAPQGFVYVEAAKESHVMDAIRGLRTVYMSKGARLVPLAEMPDALTPNRRAKDAMGEAEEEGEGREGGQCVCVGWGWGGGQEFRGREGPEQGLVGRSGGGALRGAEGNG